MHGQLIVACKNSPLATSNEETNVRKPIAQKKQFVVRYDIIFHHYPGPSLLVWPRHKEYLKLVIVMHRLCLNNSIALAAIDRECSTI